jgi:hypothetical protein
MTYTITTTMQPDVEIIVDDVEYAYLYAIGLIYSAVPGGVDPDETRYAYIFSETPVRFAGDVEIDGSLTADTYVSVDARLDQVETTLTGLGTAVAAIPADGASATASLRTLGPGAQQAAPGTAPSVLRRTIGANGPAAARMMALRRALTDGACSFAIGNLGDSTGNDTNEWFYRWGQALAGQFPAITVHHRLWSDTAQEIQPPTVIQMGTAGVRYLDGSTGTKGRRLAASQSPTLSGVIDVKYRANLASWNPGSTIVFTGRSGSEGNRGWYCMISPSGYPVFTFSQDGYAATLSAMTVTTLTGIADLATYSLRFVFTPNNGAGGRSLSVYKSPDEVTWTQIGATTTIAGTVTVNQPATLGYECGGVSGVGYTPSLNTHKVEICDGLNGPSVVPALPDLWPPYSSSSAYCVGAPILTLVNGSYPGATISYLGDATRIKRMMPNYGQVLQFLSDGHNEVLALGQEWYALYSGWVASVRATLPGVPVIALTQNPETAASTYYREHAKRRIGLLAMSEVVPVIDTFKAFLDYGANWGTDLMTDSIHPNPTGSQLWADMVAAVFAAND